jgi:hypothetical protein
MKYILNPGTSVMILKICSEKMAKMAFVLKLLLVYAKIGFLDSSF